MSVTHKLEQAALSGDKWAVIKLLSAFRRYRDAVISLSNKTDKNCNAEIDIRFVHQFFAEIADINEALDMADEADD